jgi:ribose 5-phosphate isomerase B
MKKLITERDVVQAARRGDKEIVAAPQTVITPAARDAARSRGIQFVPPRQAAAPPAAPSRRSPKGLVVLGSDHAGFSLKEILKEFVQELGYKIKDVGTFSTESVDYPDFAAAVAKMVASGEAWRGIMIDGAGVGSSIAANKINGVRAALCHDVYSARNSREHNDANVLTLGSRVIGVDIAKEVVRVWLESDFGGGRHLRRVDKIRALER